MTGPYSIHDCLPDGSTLRTWGVFHEDHRQEVYGLRCSTQAEAIRLADALNITWTEGFETGVLRRTEQIVHYVQELEPPDR